MNGFLSNVTEELKVRFLCRDATHSVMLEIIMTFCTVVCQMRAEGSFSSQGRRPFSYVRNNDFLYGFLPNES